MLERPGSPAAQTSKPRKLKGFRAKPTQRRRRGAEAGEKGEKRGMASKFLNPRPLHLHPIFLFLFEFLPMEEAVPLQSAEQLWYPILLHRLPTIISANNKSSTCSKTALNSPAKMSASFGLLQKC
ncbi:hypothetical protein SLEP1_g53043 [Rubroshorea leprosula]|uniref:Uncharacterized protein n=1 Tax=Rubroshorea leprosula TaxID=152421 RepID=A0AAV5MAY6_9ROSI|nr:hypothetical protein SLEP1_g53043 [Rubroshorea leprosula]